MRDQQSNIMKKMRNNCNITNEGKLKLEPENLKIIGVEVTGKPSDLMKFNDESIIRGATLGATTNLY